MDDYAFTESKREVVRDSRHVELCFRKRAGLVAQASRSLLKECRHR